MSRRNEEEKVSQHQVALYIGTSGEVGDGMAGAGNTSKVDCMLPSEAKGKDAALSLVPSAICAAAVIFRVGMMVIGAVRW